MAMIPSVVSNVPTLTAATSAYLGSTVAMDQAPVQPRADVGVEVAARLRGGLEGVVQSMDAAGRLADPGPAAVGRFAASKKTTAPTTKNARGETQPDATEKDSVLELFADARPESGAGSVGRLSGGLARTGSRGASGGDERVGRFRPRILPRPTRSARDTTPSAVRSAFSAGIGRFQPTSNSLSGLLSR